MQLPRHNHTPARSHWACALAWLIGAASACGDAHDTKPVGVAGAERIGEMSAALSPTIQWPADQLLPSFPAPANVVDLIQLHGRALRWDAEGSTTRHDTGRPETDGWLCQTGIDAANQYMIYGPSESGAAAG